MSGSTTNLDLIQQSQAQKEVTANALFDAASPAMFLGRRASTTSGLTWGYYGGAYQNGATVSQLTNGTVNLSANTTNYVEFDPTTGTVSANTSGFTVSRTKMYTIVCGASTVTSYTDVRVLGGGSGGAVDNGITYSTTYKSGSFCGYSNTVSNYALNSVVIGGHDNLVNSYFQDAGIFGGQYNTVNAFRSCVIGGTYSQTNGIESFASGKQANAARQGDFSRSSGQFGTVGDAQYTFNTLRCLTSSTSATELFIDGGSTQFTLPTSMRIAFDVLIVASDSSGNTASWQVRGCIKNQGGTVSLVGTPTITSLGADSSASSWTVAATADNTNKALSLKITAVANVKCVAHVRATELTI